MFTAILLTLTSAVTSAVALVHGVDSSTLVSTATYTKAKGEGFTKAIMRGFEEACDSGGEIDPNWVQSYKNARAAGITNIDVYWFPCSGSTNKCKSYADQVAEIGKTFDVNKMDIGTVWLDLEKESVCNNFDYGFSGNLAQAKAMVAALKASGYNYGIYSSPGEWSLTFGSLTPVIDSSAQLWFATYDDVETLTLKQPFGGWNTAVGKQYTDKSASGQFDLNVFAN